jgi:hypothetical protein
MRELAPGLFYATAPHPDWEPDAPRDSVEDWPRDVGWVVAEAGGRVVLIDPLLDDWDELDAVVAERPVSVLVTVPWHERSREQVVERYSASTELPAGVEAIRIESADETVFWIPGHAALVPGDCLVNRPHDDGLCLPPASWKSPTERIRGELRSKLAGLPVERVLVSHGEPILTGAREALNSALVS